MKTIKKRNKLRMRVIKKSCKIRRKKIKNNKYLKNKKQLLRLTRRLCKIKKIEKKIQNKIALLRIKNDKSYL